MARVEGRVCVSTMSGGRYGELEIDLGRVSIGLD